MTPIIEISHLQHTYLAGTLAHREALFDASLQVLAGQSVALIGPTGAGKSTLLHFCNGLLRPRESGRVIVLGHDMGRDVDLAALRRQVGLVFQNPHHQLFERFVGDDVAYGPRQMGLDEDEVDRRVQWALEAVALDPAIFADRPTLSLSGGEMRRAAIAGVLATRPAVLVLDEVTTGLDPEGRRQLHALLRRLKYDEGVTFLFVSNDLDEVAELADEVIVIHAGRTEVQGPTRDVLADISLLERCGLSAPFAPALFSSLRARGLSLRGAPLTPAEAEEELWLAWKG